MSARRHLRSAVLLALTVAGCATLPPAPRQPISPDARRVLDALEGRWREFGSLRTLADVTVQRGTERHQVRGVLLVKAPTSVRFEALSPMGQPLLIAIVHDGRLTAFDATTNEAWVGPATAEVTGRFLHLPFEADDLVGVLAGRPVPPLDVRTAELLPPDELGPSIEMTGSANRRRIWFDPETMVVRQFELTGGRAEARVRFRREAETRIAGFDLDAALGVLRASARYENPAFDVPLTSDLFRLTVTKGAKIQEIR